LSGGGASGFAHIGVLKALEENEIPIDFISGTSAGALVGALYASGMSPIEIKDYVLSDKFKAMTKGNLLKKQEFFFLNDNFDASIIEIPISIDSLLFNSLPTNFISSVLLDYEMMKLLGKTSASINNNFDSLFVPFRCVASDIVDKKGVVFKSGDLNQIVRASMTYPFFISPIKIDGKLLFDGGLYNNFPIDVLYSSFDVDYIIGSNVSSNAKTPNENNLLSQIENMLVSKSNFNLPCEDGILIEPKIDLGTFDFNDIDKAIEEGYYQTIKLIDSIRMQVNRKASLQDLYIRRSLFKSKIIPLKISKVNSDFDIRRGYSFMEKALLKPNKNRILSEEKLEKRYFRLANFEHIDQIYPVLKLIDTTYHLTLKTKLSKELKLEVGGHFSSRPINIGYLGLNYFLIKRNALKIKAESYFGRFYGSIRTYLDYTLASNFPISIRPYFTMNRWDYYRSSATFFEDVKPSFLVQDELYYGLKINNSVGNKGKNSFDYRHFSLEDNYYQTSKFTSKDTADVTRFRGNQLSWILEFNSLNRKQFANRGTKFLLIFRYVSGKEHSFYGSTSVNKFNSFKNHQWIQFNGEFQSFLINHSTFHLGVHAKTVFNSQSLFSNYTASILNATEFAPIPDLGGFFLPEYRSPQHVGFGGNIIFTFFKDIDYRIDAYFYQPIKTLELNEDGTFGYSKLLKGQTFLFSTSLIYHSPIGPLRITANYFPKQSIKSITFQNQTFPISFQLSYGFLIFNERAIR
jgi:NTE family protein